MNLIKLTMFVFSILGLGALIAIAGRSNDSPPTVSCAANKCGCKSNQAAQSDMPPDLCDMEQRCSCGSNVLPGNDLYCVKRIDLFYNKVKTLSLACIDYWRYCQRGDMRLCYKGPCAPDAQDNSIECIMPITSIGKSP